MTEARERVRAERRRRGLSLRAASVLGGVANTTWTYWENGRDELGPAMRGAVAKTFGWSTMWPYELPPVQPTDLELLHAKLDQIIARLDRLEIQHGQHEKMDDVPVLRHIRALEPSEES